MWYHGSNVPVKLPEDQFANPGSYSGITRVEVRSFVMFTAGRKDFTNGDYACRNVC